MTLCAPRAVAAEPESASEREAERRAAAAIVAYGGWAEVVQSDGRRVVLRKDEPLPEFDHVINLVLVPGDGCNPKALEQLPYCTHLRFLLIDDLPFGDKECGLLAQPGTELRHLERLRLSGTSVGDAGCGHLKRLSALQRLELGGTNVGDAGCAELKELKNLKRLFLFRTKVGDAGAAHLAELKTLVELSLNFTKVGDAGAEALKSLPKLETLELPGTEVTDEGLKHLAEMKSLKRLYVGGTKAITDEGITNLKPLADQLEYLGIWGPLITDRGRENLKEFKFWKLEQARNLEFEKKLQKELKKGSAFIPGGRAGPPPGQGSQP
jgi:hypothetical protein